MSAPGGQSAVPSGLDEAGLLRLAAQRLVGERADDAAGAVRWMTALQAQQLPDALAAVALRTRGAASTAGIRRAIDDGVVVRSWPMRGTLHLVLGEDLRWMLSLTAEGLLRGAARRREQLGITTAVLEGAERVARESLTGTGLVRSELLARWEQAGLLGVPGRGYHLLWNLSQRGVTVLGPFEGAEQRVVLLEEWVPHGRRLEREEALGEWVLRYLRSHGPASRADVAAWLKLPLRDVDLGIAQARTHLAEIVVDGVSMLLDPATPDRLAAARAEAAGTMLVPAFDEILLGYRDRRATLAPEHQSRVVPGGNGIFRPVVVDAGRAVATWRRGRTSGTVEVEPFDAERPPDADRIAVAARAWPAEGIG